MLELNKVYLGDCLSVMMQVEDNSIDTIITDPPYGLSFMGKKWDYDVPSVEVWKECLRVLKPGGTALIFAGTRTQHRMAVNIEDAGFILKDCIMWLYGSGFPKAMDISKEIDKKVGAKREIISSRKVTDIRGGNYGAATQGIELGKMEYSKTAPATEEAKLWNGWKSHGLKPAYEPILVVIKPNDGNYIENALKHGVSGLNIEGARIPHNEDVKKTTREAGTGEAWNDSNCGLRNGGEGLASADPNGRFPANVILDEEAAKLLDQQTGTLKSGSDCVRTKEGSFLEHGGLGKAGDAQKTYGDSGGASRFFYCAKASSSERNEGCDDLAKKENAGSYKFREDGSLDGKPTSPKANTHPTVKPLKLMEYLCILTKTPTGGIVLDPFAGSGTTGLAAKNTNRNFILIEKEPEYIEIAQKRISK